MRTRKLAAVFAFSLTAVSLTQTVTGSKPHAFDVVSIKPAQPGENRGRGLTPTGYSSMGYPISVVLRQAFFPRNWNGKIVGAPGWVNGDFFDIEAKVTPDDLDEWQKERTQLSQPLMQQLLQNMLADRLKLVAHRVPSQTIGYAILLDKHGPKLTEAAPSGPRPDHGIPLAGGGYTVPYRDGEVPHLSFYGVTMEGLVQRLAGMGGQVVDRTGLTGRYDFTLTWLSGPDEEQAGVIESNDPDKLSHWNFGALGLRAEQVKLPTEDLVIDHIERPSPN